MSTLFSPLHLLSVALAGWMNRHQQAIIGYLVTENLSVANSYLRGDRELVQTPAMLFPSEIAQCGRMRDQTAAPLGRRAAVERGVCSRLIEITLET